MKAKTIKKTSKLRNTGGQQNNVRNISGSLSKNRKTRDIQIKDILCWSFRQLFETISHDESVKRKRCPQPTILTFFANF